MPAEKYRKTEKHRKYSREYMARRMKEDPDFKKRQIKSHRLSDKKNKDKISELVAEFRSRGCSLCQEKEPCCMSSHHVGKKTFMISQAITKKISWRKVAEELKECVCVCENCHRKIHAGILKI